MNRRSAAVVVVVVGLGWVERNEDEAVSGVFRRLVLCAVK